MEKGFLSPQSSSSDKMWAQTCVWGYLLDVGCNDSRAIGADCCLWYLLKRQWNGIAINSELGFVEIN